MKISTSPRVSWLLTLMLSLLCACSSRYQVVLNNNVLYSPYETNRMPSLVNDANLQGCINQQLTAIDDGDPEKITLLACPSAGIESLAGIRSLPNLEQLELSDNAISDLTPLLNLENLRVLSVRNNRIANINPLLSLPLLRFVALQGNNSINCEQLQALEQKIGNTLNKPDRCSN